MEGTVTDATYTAGSLRYRVELAQGAVVTVRMPSERGLALHAPGTRVTVAWKVSDTMVIEGD